MAVKSFFLIQADLSTYQALDIAQITSIKDPVQWASHEFNILDTKRIFFEGISGAKMGSIDIANDPVPFRITIDDQQVRRPQGPPPFPIVGNYFQIYPNHLENHARLFRKYGSIIRTENMGITTHVTNDPETARHVFKDGLFFTKKTSEPQHPLYYMRDQTGLFTCDTESPAFRVSYKFIPPGLSPQAIEHYTPLIRESMEASFNVFDELEMDGKVFNVYQYMFKLAGQIIYRVILGLDLAHFDSINKPPHEIIQSLGKYLELMKKVQLRGSWYSYLPFGNPTLLRNERQRIFGLVSNAIEHAKSSVKAISRYTKLPRIVLRAVDEKGKKLPPELILSNSVALLGAGFITSASLLSWLIYALVQHPLAQARLRAEVLDRRPYCGQGWTYAELQSMSYLNNFVKETQRLYSPSFQAARVANKNVVLPGGYYLPENSVIIASFPHMQTNEAYWEEPEQFNPDRWETDRVKNRHQSAYIPFAAGTRACTGSHVALHEVRVVLTSLVARYVFHNASIEQLEYDPEFLVTRPLNLYVKTERL